MHTHGVSKHKVFDTSCCLLMPCIALDIAHMNSVDKFDNGDYLISARHTNTIYKVSALLLPQLTEFERLANLLLTSFEVDLA